MKTILMDWTQTIQMLHKMKQSHQTTLTIILVNLQDQTFKE
jgi:hypothetical protein